MNEDEEWRLEKPKEEEKEQMRAAAREWFAHLAIGLKYCLIARRLLTV